MSGSYRAHLVTRCAGRRHVPLLDGGTTIGHACRVPSNHHDTPSPPSRKLRSSCPHRLTRARTRFSAHRPRPILAPTRGSRSCPGHVQRGSRPLRQGIRAELRVFQPLDRFEGALQLAGLRVHGNERSAEKVRIFAGVTLPQPGNHP